MRREPPLKRIETDNRLTEESRHRAMTKPTDFNSQERASFYRLIGARRDVRQFRPDPIPTDVLQRVLEAAHAAPSVGLMQPWNFLVVQSKEIRQQIKDSFATVNEDEKAKLAGTPGMSFTVRSSWKAFWKLRSTSPSLAIHNAAAPLFWATLLGPRPAPQCVPTIENLWLAARTEGLGVGWVSLLEKKRVARIFSIAPGDRIDRVPLHRISPDIFRYADAGRSRVETARDPGSLALRRYMGQAV